MQSPGSNGSRSTPGALSLTGLRPESWTRKLAPYRALELPASPAGNSRPAKHSRQSARTTRQNRRAERERERERIFSARPELEGAIANGSRECAPDDRLRVLRRRCKNGGIRFRYSVRT